MTIPSWLRGLARATERTQRTFVLAVLLWTAAASPSLANTYTTLDYPGSLTTGAIGIDGNNIVGNYTGSSPGVHGYLYNGTAYTTLDHPLGTNGSVPRGISGGNIVGLYNDASFGFHGYLYNGTNFTTLDHPLATHGTRAFGIDGDNIVGMYIDDSFGTHGFLYDGTTYTTLDFPLVGTSRTEPNGISGNNIVGTYHDSSGAHGFLYDGTTYTTLEFPGSSFTEANGIDGNNIVGTYNDGSTDHGFLYDGTTYTTLDFPGSSFTFVQGIDGNHIVGAYHDSSGTHGFVLSAFQSISISGDFDVDGDVDGRDFLIWQRGGSPNPLSAGDLANWKTNFGAPFSASANSAAVPEPSTGILAIIMAVGSRHRRRRTTPRVATIH